MLFLRYAVASHAGPLVLISCALTLSFWAQMFAACRLVVVLVLPQSRRVLGLCWHGVCLLVCLLRAPMYQPRQPFSCALIFCWVLFTPHVHGLAGAAPCFRPAWLLFRLPAANAVRQALFGCVGLFFGVRSGGWVPFGCVDGTDSYVSCIMRLRFCKFVTSWQRCWADLHCVGGEDSSSKASSPGYMNLLLSARQAMDVPGWLRVHHASFWH